MGKTSSLAGALGAVALLSACQSHPRVAPSHHPEPVEATDCKGVAAGRNRDDCTILVNIVESGSRCTVSVQTDQDVVEFERGAPNKWILWQIDANPGGYKFTSQGVKFKSDPHSNFKNGQAIANGQIFRWKNSNGTGDAGEYFYGIEVSNRKSGISCSFDPSIKNQA